MKVFKEIEKMLIAHCEESYYDTFMCPKHGVVQIKKGSNMIGCVYPSCKKELEKIENVTELKEQFRKELGIE